MTDHQADTDQIITHILRNSGSGGRATMLADILEQEMLADVDPAGFWKVIASIWDVCDNTWTEQDRLLGMMREAGPAGHLSSASASDRITIFRGCDISRVFGMSWTTSLGVAETFSRGHRGIAVQRPVVARAWVQRSRIMATFEERGEVEMLVDPLDLRGVRIL